MKVIIKDHEQERKDYKVDKHQKLLDYLNCNEGDLEIFIKINNPLTESIGFQETLNQNKEAYRVHKDCNFEIQMYNGAVHSVNFQTQYCSGILEENNESRS